MRDVVDVIQAITVILCLEGKGAFRVRQSRAALLPS